MFPPRLRLTGGVIEQTDRYLSVSKQEGVEVVVYWSGILTGDIMKVRHVWFPKQLVSPAYFEVESNALFELNRNLHRLGEVLAGQAHTHPFEAFHSDADDRNAVSLLEGAYSAVVPDFGAYSVGDLDHTIFFQRRLGQWVELGRAEARRHIEFEGLTA